MAHMEKLSGKNNIYGLVEVHNNRKKEDPSHERERENKNIDPEKSRENYDLVGRESPYQYFKDRTEELDKERMEQTGQHLRKDAVRACSIVCHLPEDRLDRGEKYERAFFRGVVDYAKEQFGERNIVQAVVHKDENRPHIHVVCIPVTKAPDRSGREYERVSFRDAFSRKDYGEMHERLQEHCRERTHDRDLKLYDEEREKVKTVSKEKYIQQKEEEREREREKEDKERLERAREKLPALERNGFGFVSKENYDRFLDKMTEIVKSADREVERAERDRDRAEYEKDHTMSVRESALESRWNQASDKAKDLQRDLEQEKEKTKEYERDHQLMDYFREEYPDHARKLERLYERDKEQEREREQVKHHGKDRDYER